MPINKKPGESKDEFISRCIGVEVGDGKEADQAAAICYAKWDEETLSKISNIRREKFVKGACRVINLQSYSDYPKEAQENAKIALRWAEKWGWGSCGTAVGKQRANQLAKGEPISRDTIARMAAFERHRQNSQKELGDGCGRLMWLAWGGDAGVEWAQRKLDEIDTEKFKIINGNTRTRNGSIRSSNVWKFKWDDKTGDLVVKFQDGSVYTYRGVSADDFESFRTGSGGTCDTSGEVKVGGSTYTWEVGKNPSVGAAVFDVLVSKYGRGSKGGSI